jgi:hypothetical protein
MDNTLPEKIPIVQLGISGALIQLVAYGASDVFLVGNTGIPQCYNINDSIKNWFINNKHGYADTQDIEAYAQKIPSVFAHYPDYLKPSPNDLKPFSLKKEKSAVKIQKAWRQSIGNPAFAICKNRLMREFGVLTLSSSEEE